MLEKGSSLKKLVVNLNPHNSQNQLAKEGKNDVTRMIDSQHPSKAMISSMVLHGSDDNEKLS